MTLLDTVKSQVGESARVKEALLQDGATLQKVAEVAQLLIGTYKAGGKTLWAGNGGSAADAQHMAAELVNKFRLNRSGLPALALTVDTSILTAIGNDYGYDQVFVRQIEACGQPGDVFIGISTSGNSANLVKALSACRAHGIVTVALVGGRPCQMDDYDHVIHVPSEDTPRIQECQTLIGHILCDAVEQSLFGANHFL
ncbi:MAG: D-sedoheptulose 7-phosphate isomerase [Bacteroidales bacterium]|nr:D-sedoheptulose 7-phosphate isomerase [Bacteroidales bacterium]